MNKVTKKNLLHLSLKGVFRSISNSGTSKNGKYKYQCMWMSISWYLVHVLGYTDMDFIKIRDLLLECGFVINKNMEEFDFSLHGDALNFICEHFNLTLIICLTDIFTNKIDVSNSMKFGEGIGCDGIIRNNRVLYIVYNGGHFETIYQIESHVLYDTQIETLQSSKEITCTKKYTEPLNIKKDVHTEIDDFNSIECIISLLEKNKINIIEKINELNQRLLQIQETNPQEIELKVIEISKQFNELTEQLTLINKELQVKNDYMFVLIFEKYNL